MANRLLKGLAIAAGTGLAVGFTSGRARTDSVRDPTTRLNGHSDPVPSAGQAPAEFSDIEPLLERMERLEARLDQIVREGAIPAPAAPISSDSLPAGYAESIADLERRVERNTREMELLRKSVVGAEARMAESAASAERRLEQTRAELPALVESQVTARLGDLQTRFTAEIDQSHLRTLEVFERALDEKISSRIGVIEKALGEQAGSIGALGTRAAETDTNLQRLVTAIERLCERAQLIPTAGEQQPGRTPFESQLGDAMKGNPAVPVLRTGEPPPQPEPKKSRFLFRNLMVAGFGLLASRFLS